MSTSVFRMYIPLCARPSPDTRHPRHHGTPPIVDLRTFLDIPVVTVSNSLVGLTFISGVAFVVVPLSKNPHVLARSDAARTCTSTRIHFASNDVGIDALQLVIVNDLLATTNARDEPRRGLEPHQCDSSVRHGGHCIATPGFSRWLWVRSYYDAESGLQRSVRVVARCATGITEVTRGGLAHSTAHITTTTTTTSCTSRRLSLAPQ